MCNMARLARTALGIGALAIFTDARASAADPIVSSYTPQDARGLTYCVGLTDTAFAVAERKLRGAALGDVRVDYAARPRAEVMLPLVDKVYEDEFTSSWDYALRFFGECGVNIVEIPQLRLGGASECLQRSMIASLAQVQKAGGARKDAVYAYFGKFPADTTHAVIDEVFAKTQERPAAALAAWNACMAPLTRAE